MVNGEIRENQMPVYTEADLYETDSKDYEQCMSIFLFILLNFT